MAARNVISIIGEQTRTVGTILSDDVLIIAGEVEGEIRGRKVVIKATARVLGTITCGALVVEDGAIFDGQAYMNFSPTSAQA